MTTGRINQVTTFPTTLWRTAMSTKLLGRPESHLSFGGSSSLIRSNRLNSKPSESLRTNVHRTGYWCFSDHKVETTLFPNLTLFRRTASCLLQQKSWPSERTTCDLAKNNDIVMFTKATVDSQMY